MAKNLIEYQCHCSLGFKIWSEPKYFATAVYVSETVHKEAKYESAAQILNPL